MKILHSLISNLTNNKNNSVPQGENGSLQDRTIRPDTSILQREECYGAIKCPEIIANTLRDRTISHDANNENTIFRPSDIDNDIEYKDYKKFRQDIDYMIYCQPVSVNPEHNMESFFKPLIKNNFIRENMLLEPLIPNDKLIKGLTEAGYKLDPSRPGVFKNKTEDNTIVLRTRKTEQGETEWNLFFKGVNPTKIKSLLNAAYNIARGMNSSSINKKKSTLELYDVAKKATIAFVEAASNTKTDDGKDIVITLAGHSMGGRLAQAGLSACFEKIKNVYIFQAMDSTGTEKELIADTQKIQIKIKDFHMTGDTIIGGLKQEIYSSEIKPLIKRKFIRLSTTITGKVQ